MKNRPPSLLEGLGYAFSTKMLSFVMLLATCVIAIPMFLLWEKTQIEALRVLAAMMAFVGLLASIFVPKEIVARMAEDESMSLAVAVAHTWYHYLLCLVFVPVIGPIVQRFVEGKKKSPFVVDEDKRA